MKIVRLGVLLSLVPFFCLISDAAPTTFDLRSPDGTIEFRVRAVGQIEYDLVVDGRAVMEHSTLALDVEHTKLGINPKVIEAKTTSFDQVFEPVVRQKFAQIHDQHNELRLTMSGGYAVVFRVYNQGAAYRLETNFPKSQVKVFGEEANFRFPRNYAVYYPQEDGFYSHNERRYLPRRLNEILPEFMSSLPAVVDLEQPGVPGVKVAIAESDVDDYPGLWLKGTAPEFGLAATFPPYPLKEVQTSDRDYRVTETADYIAVTAGTRTFPWRVLGIARQDGDLITNQIVWLLERASQVQDTSWIQPGKVAWDWWNDWNVAGPGVDFHAGINTQTYKYYVDFASKYNIPYIILDDGWYVRGDLLKVVPEVNMEELTGYAKQKNVGVILWASWKTLDDQLIPALDQFQQWGIRGIKVDFMQRSDQLMINYFYRVCREAAKRHMLVDFHGDQKPATMTRTWPNLINTEGVRGMEWSKWSWESEPKHNVTLPFTRMFLGPMDYTPGAMRNATRHTFAAISAQPMAMGTRCHQLAMYVVYEGPLQMLSDTPSNYLREPETMEFLGPVPTVWDDTRVLDGRIAEYVVVARKNGNTWYIGAMSDWTARDLEVNLSFLPPGNLTMTAYQDGVNADRDASDYRKVTAPVDQTSKLKIHLAPGGGWAAMIRP